MKYYYKLYASESLEKKKLRILSRIDEGEFIVNKYLIVLAQNEINHLEFFDSAFVTQKMVEKQDLFVVGLAEGYAGAVQIVESIVNEVLTMTGGTNIRGYLLEKQLEFENRNG